MEPRLFTLLFINCSKKIFSISRMEISCFSFSLLLFSIFSSGLMTVHAYTGIYGINYGRLADNIPAPESVVTLLKAAKIKNVRIYDADHSVLNAFRGSGLELVVGIPNGYLKDMSVNGSQAMEWVRENVKAFQPDANIVGIAVGNEILGGTDQELAQALLPAAKNVYNAIEMLGLTNQVQVQTAHSEAVFAASYPPSACTFKEDVLQYMKPLLELFSRTGSPFFINAYPFLAYKSDPEHIDINYALFKPNAGIVDSKTGLHYDNMFDAQVDAVYFALEAAGFRKMEVIVSETGWASKGDGDEAGATVENARIYNYNLRKRLAMKKGTPYRPKIAAKAYIFALFNEYMKPGPTSERNFGLFKADGSIAYDIGFTGLKPSSTRSLLLKEREPLKCIQYVPKIAQWAWSEECDKFKRKVNASPLSTLKISSYTRIDRVLVFAFIERWHLETNTFHLPFGEMTITLDDVRRITSLPVDGRAVHAPEVRRDEAACILRVHLGISEDDGLYELKLNKCNYVRMEWLRDQFAGKSRDSDSTDVIDRHVRAYLLYLLGCSMFSDKTGTKVHVAYLHLLADIEEVKRYSWGSAGLAYLYRQMGVASRFEVKQITGYLTLLEAWIYEHFSVERPAPNLKYNPTHPRAMRWRSTASISAADAPNRLKHIRHLLDTLIKENDVRTRGWSMVVTMCVVVFLLVLMP